MDVAGYYPYAQMDLSGLYQNPVSPVNVYSSWSEWSPCIAPQNAPCGENGQQKRTLSVNDLSGGNAVMARNLSGCVCAIVTMAALTVRTCALVAPTASFTANSTTVCPGETIIFCILSPCAQTSNA